MRHAAVFLMAVAAVLGGCGLLASPPPQDPPILTIVGSRGHEAHLRFTDNGGRLRAVADERSEELRAHLGDIGIAAVPGRPNSLYLAWVVSPCERELLLRLSSSFDRLEIVVLDMPRDCEALRIAYGVRLDFNVQIGPADLDVVLIRN